MDAVELKRRTADALKVAKEYSTSDAVRSVVALLSCLENEYRSNLEAVEVDKLVPLQTALRQVVTLKRAISEDGFVDPKIL